MSLSRLSPRLLALLLGGALSTPVASAQQEPLNDALSLERMRLATNRSGLISVESGTVPEHLAWDAGIWMGWSSNPLVLVRLSDGARVGSLVSSRVGGSVVGSLGLFGWAQLGFELPVVAFQERQLGAEVLAGGLPPLTAGGLGDLRLVPKVRLLNSAEHGLDLAVQAGFIVPTGRDAGFIGDTRVAFHPELALSRSFGALRMAGNLGVAVRPTRTLLNLTVQSELSGQLGVGYRLGARGGSGLPLEVELALAGNVGARRPLARSNENSFELRGMVTYDVSKPVQLFVGAGRGFSGGWGTPDWRAFGGVRLSTWESAPRASVAVVSPAPVPEVPLPPKDTGERAKATLAVVAKAENPVPTKAQELCPAQNPSTPTPKGITLTRDRITLDESFHFAPNKDVVQKDSYPLLDSIAALLQAHPEIGHVRVEGHTDNQGKHAHNLKLSHRRAQAIVGHLVQRGIAAERLEAQGFGPTRPVTTNRTAEGRATNRRVEFHIVSLTPVATSKN
jgi:outer membrane protein OmpA-like peptidoglycan-associated protein